VANPPKQKGTKAENEIMALLHGHGMDDAHRTEASRASHDIWCDPIVVEVKFRKAWAVMDWIRKIRNAAPDNRWAIYAIHGDRRTAAGSQVGTVAIMDAEFATEVLAFWRSYAVPLPVTRPELER